MYIKMRFNKIIAMLVLVCFSCTTLPLPAFAAVISEQNQEKPLASAVELSGEEVAEQGSLTDIGIPYQAPDPDPAQTESLLGVEGDDYVEPQRSPRTTFSYAEDYVAEDAVILEEPLIAPMAVGNYPVPEKIISAPYVYEYENNEKVNLNTGDFMYEPVDAIVPGVNGMDLVIGRRYYSTEANLTHVSGTGGSLGNHQHHINNDMNEMYGLGTGWGFMFPGIEEHFSNNYLRLRDGGLYRYESTSEVIEGRGKVFRIVGYPRSDIELFGRTDGSGKRLDYKDGRKDYFDSQGRLARMEDRFGNSIVFAYANQSGALPNISIRIMDSNSNVINTTTIVGSVVNGQQIVTVTLPDASTLKYTVGQWASRPDVKTITEFKDQENNTTKYEYSISQGRVNAHSKTWNDASVNIDSVEYLLLRHVVHPDHISNPENYVTTFGYAKRSKYTVSTLKTKTVGIQEYYALTSRLDSVYPSPTGAGKTYNRVNYSYSNNYTEELNNPSLNYDYIYYTNVTIGDIVTMHAFSKDHQEKRQAQGIKESPDRQYFSIKEIEYGNFGNPKKITTYQFAPNSNIRPYNYSCTPPTQNLSQIEAFSYDKKANLHEYSLNGNLTTYQYDSNYNLLTSKDYYQSSGKKITETYVLSPDKKTVKTLQISEGNTPKAKTEYVYDVHGNPTRERQYRDGLSTYTETQYTYYRNAYLSEVRNVGIYNADNTLAKGTSGNNDGIIYSAYQYDNMGRITNMYDQNNRRTSWQYDKLGNVTKQTNHADNSTVLYERDYQLNWLTVTNEEGYKTRYTYLPIGLEESVFDHEGNIISAKEYNAQAQIDTEYNYVNGGKTKYLYDSRQRLKSKTVSDYNDNDVQYSETYDYTDIHALSGPYYQRTVKTIQGIGTGEADIITTQYVDYLGNVAKEGKVYNTTEYLTSYTYDFVGNCLTERTPYAESSSRSYSTMWDYDYASRVIKTYNIDGGAAAYQYNALGHVTMQSNFGGEATNYKYDDLGRLLEEWCYVDTSATSRKQYTYNPLGNITQTRITNNPVGQAVTWAKTAYDYDNRERLEYVTLYNGSNIDNVTKYAYDKVGNITNMYTGLSSKTATNGKHTSYTYDHHGYIATMTDPLGQTEEYANNAHGNPWRKKDRNNVYTFYNYNELGKLELVRIAAQGESLQNIATYTYAGNGNIASVTGPVGTISYAYDELGRLKKETEDGGITKEYTYDIGDNRQTFVLKRNSNVIQNLYYTYDNQSRLKTVRDNGANGVLQASYAYYNNGARQSVTYNANGTSEHYTYNRNNNGLWLTKVENKRGSTLLSSYTYTYYADGNQRTKQDDHGRLTTYSYDEAGRLKREEEKQGANIGFAVDYQYDRQGNRENMAVSGNEAYNVTYTYDANNRLTKDCKEIDGVSIYTNYSYDNNGNQLAKWQESLAPQSTLPSTIGFDASGVELYEYNSQNQLVWALIEGEEIDYAYRIDGLRHSKQTTAGTVTHLWDGQNIVADLQDGNLSNRYIRGINLLASVDNMNNRKYYLYNGHGDVVQLAGSTGDVLWEYDYDAFGNEREIAGQDASQDNNPFRYCGEYYDCETGTIYLRARTYNPSVGRFTQEDVIRGINREMHNEQKLVDPLSLNLYAYVHNNPVRYIDSSGNFPVDTAFDIFSLSLSFYDLGMNPSWTTAGYFLWDLFSSFLPYVPGSYVIKGTNMIMRAGTHTSNMLGIAKRYEKVVSAVSRSGVTIDRGQNVFDVLLSTKRLGNIGDILLSSTRDTGLAKFIGDNWRTVSRIGNGGTADAIRHTMRTGELVGGSDHIQKGWEGVNRLINIMRTGRLDAGDYQLALALYQDLMKALKNTSKSDYI